MGVCAGSGAVVRPGSWVVGPRPVGTRGVELLRLSAWCCSFCDGPTGRHLTTHDSGHTTVGAGSHAR